MEQEDRCWCACEGGVEAEAGFQCHRGYLIQLQKERHRRRMAQFVAAALLLLLCGVLAVFLTVRLERPCDSAPDSRTGPNTDHHSSGVAEKLQSAVPPSAMLTGNPAGCIESVTWSIHSSWMSMKRQWTVAGIDFAAISHVSGGNEMVEKYLLWEYTVGQAYILGGFNYTNGNLVVPRKGLYRVFLQITYQITEPVCPDGDFLTLSNNVYVFKDSYREDKTLLSAVDTVACSSPGLKKSLFTSGLFNLAANDILRVTSTHPNYIVKKEHQVFFGAELVFDL